MKNNLKSIRPRVFVSSVVEGFQQYRDAARRAINNTGGEPILVNEDFPALMDSSRNTCLDAVDSADFFIIILGNQGGSVTPSGRLVIEEEYERAKRKKIPIFVFLQKAERDIEAQRFANILSDYVDGFFRITFQSPKDLEEEVERALRPLLFQTKKAAMNEDEFFKILQSPYLIPNETNLRLVIRPERNEEVVDLVKLGSDDFIHRIYEIAHGSGVCLLNYQCQKSHNIKIKSLVIHQSDPSGPSRRPFEDIRLEIYELGQIIIDSNVTGRVVRDESHSMLNTLVIAHEDIEAVLRSNFHFCEAFFEEVDKFKRHQRFFYGVVLSNIGHRKLVKNPKKQESYTMNFLGDEHPFNIFDRPRLISRSDLGIRQRFV